MEFKFDANQEFQVQAVDAICDLFDGQIHIRAQVSFNAGTFTLASIPNRLDLDDVTLLKNLQDVQRRNGIQPDERLEYIEETIQTVDGEKAARFPNFSVEMETGTGKTYVYLRTILELNRRYGMRKFIVVVPSVAIREGVFKTLKVTAKHFRELFGNPVYRYYKYDSANLSQVRQFAQSDSVEIMVMTLDSFNKASNVIRQSTDRLQGETPLFLVQAARPILILDEPQNMESEKAIAALATLDPLMALRYSATHRNPYNVVYRLTPAEAYRQGLVKKIEVDSVIRENAENQPYLRLEAIQTQKRTITAKITVHKLMKSGQVKETAITVRPGDSLEEKTNRAEYASFMVDEINPGAGFVRFANNIELGIGEELGADRDVLFDAQIRHTIEEHMRKQARLNEKGIKVLSLFFIDKVANYASEDGIIRKLFDQAFDDLKARYPGWNELSPSEVRAAYFAEKRRRSGETEALDSVSGETKEDEAAYDLIMRDKEALLSFPGPGDDEETRRKKQVSFIFSHSALREGWDNPNIFQICTLNQTVSAIKKRQEVGRGIRLAVDQSGRRLHDNAVNILTVIANESYRRYVETYQDEIAFEYRSEIEGRYGKSISDLSDEERRKVEEEYGEGILPPQPRQAGEQKAKLRKARVLSEEFKELWERIKHKTRYAVRIDTEALLAEVISEVDRADIAPPRVTITKASVIAGDDGIFEAMQLSQAKNAADLAGRWPLPNLIDLMADLMENTTPPIRLTRRTLLEVYRRAGNKKAAIDNPHEWATVAIRIIKEKLAIQLVRGVEYIRISDGPGADSLPDDEKWYEMRQILDDTEVELFSKYIEPTREERSVYDLVPCDSDVERQFVRDLEARQDVKLYLKLPYWFTVPTPVGEYRPDWAIVMESKEEAEKPILYLVTETKGSLREAELRPNEWRRIQCGAAHFGSKQLGRKGALEEVDYKVVTKARELP
ncbi:DEAD/DEAH box helicase family protein [Methanoculleus methanifontis]|nr:DEAD/DEAH box helicase family protein [Methanoculleus sp. FWC-SCC3]